MRLTQDLRRLDDRTAAVASSRAVHIAVCAATAAISVLLWIFVGLGFALAPVVTLGTYIAGRVVLSSWRRPSSASRGDSTPH